MKILLANWELKVLAVMSAIIFWILVIGTENTFYRFPDEVQIKAFNISDDLVVSGDLGKVKLRLKAASSDVVKNLAADDFNAYVDLQGLKEGQLEVPVLVSSKKSEISVLKVEPSTVKINIEKKAEKEVPIEYKTNGNVKDGFIVKEVLLTEKVVMLKGAQDILNDISAATAVIALNGEDKSLKKVFPIKILDKDGNEIPNITPDKTETEAEVKIAAVTGQKTVGVKPNIIGTPSVKVWIKSINVTPSIVTLNGSQENLKTIEYAQTTGIDVENLDANKIFTVKIEGLPEGVTVEGDPEISVSIEVEKYSSVDTEMKRKTVNVPVIIKKFKSSQANYSINPTSITLVAEGLAEDIGKMTSNLKIELDISSNMGSEAVFDIDESYFSLPDTLKIVSISPESVKVTWEKKSN